MKTLLLFILCWIPIYGFTQIQAPLDPRILEVYGSQAEIFQKSDPELIFHLEKLLNIRFEVRTLPYETGEKFPRLSQVSLMNKFNPDLQRDLVFKPETFNPLKYELDLFAATDKVYRVDQTDYILFIKGQRSNP